MVLRLRLLFWLLPIWLPAYGLAPSRVNTMDFYSTVAQIVPVLLLVLAIEARLFEPTRENPGEADAVAAFLLLAALLFSEYEALRPLISGKLSDGRPEYVIAGLVLGFVSVAVVAVVPARERP